MQVGGVFVILASVIIFAIAITTWRLLVRIFRAYRIFRRTSNHNPTPLPPLPPSTATTASDLTCALKGSFTTTTSALSFVLTSPPPLQGQSQPDIAAALKGPAATHTVRQALSKAFVHVFLRSSDGPTGDSSPCTEIFLPEFQPARPIKCNPTMQGAEKGALMPSPFAQHGSPFKVPLTVLEAEPSSPVRNGGQHPSGPSGGSGLVRLHHQMTDLQSSPSMRREKFRTSGGASSINKLGMKMGSIDRTALASAFKQVFRTQPSLSRTEDLGFGVPGLNATAVRTNSGTHALGWTTSGAQAGLHQGHHTLMSSGSAQYTDLLRATPEDVAKRSPSASQQSASATDRTSSGPTTSSRGTHTRS